MRSRAASYLRRWPVVLAALAYLAVGTATLWPSIRPGRTLVAADILVLQAPYSTLPGRAPIHNLLVSDTPYQFFPWLKFTGDALRHGHFPQWNPAELGGLPVTPNGFVNVHYPPVWLAAVMAPFDAYNAFVLFHLVLGALGVFVFARTLGARNTPAWVGGLLVFGAGFWVHWSTHLLHIAGMVWLPWALAATTAVVDRPNPRRVAALAVVFGLWWLGANPQYAYYGTLTMGAWAVALLIHRRVTGHRGVVLPSACVLASITLGVALAAPVLLPTASRAGKIVRQAEPQASSNHMPKRQAIRFMVPDAYGNSRDGVYFRSTIELEMDSPFLGVTALLLCAACLGGGGRRRWMLLGAVGAVLVIAFSGFTHELFFAVLPGYDRFRVNARWLSVLPALVMPLAALGLDRLLDGDRRTRRALLASGAVAVVATVGWFLLVRGDAGALEGYFLRRGLAAAGLITAVVAAGCLVSRRPRAGMAVIVVIALVEIGLGTTPWYPSVRERDAYPIVAVGDIARQRGGRLVRVGPRTQFPPYAPNLPMVAGGIDAEGQTVLFPRDYDRFLRLIEDYGDEAKSVNNAPPLSDARLLSSPLLDVLDVRTVVTGPDVAMPARYPLLDGGDPHVYGRSSLGPAVLVPAAQPVGEEEMWRRVADPGWDPAATAAVVGLRQPVDGGPGTVVLQDRAQPEHEGWDVDAPGGGFLRVSGNWDPGWTASVDGRPAPVLRADGVFRGVVLGSGRHRVAFNFDNVDEGKGRLVAYGALPVLGLLACGFPRRRRRANACPAEGGGADSTREGHDR